MSILLLMGCIEPTVEPTERAAAVCAIAIDLNPGTREPTATLYIRKQAIMGYCKTARDHRCLADVRVTLISEHGELSDISDLDGRFGFVIEETQEFTLCVTPPEGWIWSGMSYDQWWEDWTLIFSGPEPEPEVLGAAVVQAPSGNVYVHGSCEADGLMVAGVTVHIDIRVAAHWQTYSQSSLTNASGQWGITVPMMGVEKVRVWAEPPRGCAVVGMRAPGYWHETYIPGMGIELDPPVNGTTAGYFALLFDCDIVPTATATFTRRPTWTPSPVPTATPTCTPWPGDERLYIPLILKHKRPFVEPTVDPSLWPPTVTPTRFPVHTPLPPPEDPVAWEIPYHIQIELHNMMSASRGLEPWSEVCDEPLVRWAANQGHYEARLSRIAEYMDSNGQFWQALQTHRGTYYLTPWGDVHFVAGMWGPSIRLQPR